MPSPLYRFETYASMQHITMCIIIGDGSKKIIFMLTSLLKEVCTLYLKDYVFFIELLSEEVRQEVMYNGVVQ